MKTNRKVPFFDYPQVYLRDKENLLQIFDEVCSRGALFYRRIKNNLKTIYQNLWVQNILLELEMQLMV